MLLNRQLWDLCVALTFQFGFRVSNLQTRLALRIMLCADLEPLGRMSGR
jgi:hypothetical protein